MIYEKFINSTLSPDNLYMWKKLYNHFVDILRDFTDYVGWDFTDY